MQLNRVLAEEPAKLAGVADRKGKIQVGYDADIIVSQPLLDPLFRESPRLLSTR
jgi:dihydroorotase-like cyclic amidohydrolase